MAHIMSRRFIQKKGVPVSIDWYEKYPQPMCPTFEAVWRPESKRPLSGSSAAGRDGMLGLLYFGCLACPTCCAVGRNRMDKAVDLCAHSHRCVVCNSLSQLLASGDLRSCSHPVHGSVVVCYFWHCIIFRWIDGCHTVLFCDCLWDDSG